MTNTGKNQTFTGTPPSQIGGNKNTNQETAVAPRFLIVKGKEGDFAKTNPFLLSNFIYGKVGKVKNLKKIREGLLIETCSAAQSRAISKLNVILDQEVEVVPHSRLNQSRGVVTCRDLLNCKEEEILEELKDQGVIEVKRIKTKKDGVLTDTASHILTFNTPKLPVEINVAFYLLKIRPYIPAPLRCFRCQLFGHAAIRCTKEQVCVCGKSLHTGQPCEPPISCINCNGLHSARSRDCPVYKQEVAIQEIKIKDNLSYFEAKKKVAVHTPKRNTSYSQVITTPRPTIINPPIIDTKELLKELVPLIVSALQKNFTLSPAQPEKEQPEINIAESLINVTESLVSDNPSLSQISKRHRSEDSTDEESFSSQTSTQEKTKRKKKTKSSKPPGRPPGRPPGKSRKNSLNNLEDVHPPEVPLPQQTGSM